MDNICVSILAKDYNFYIEVVKKYDFVELRLDEGKLSVTQIGEIISAGKKIITTCRSGFIPDEKRFEILLSAINHGTDYIDIEHNFEPVYKNKLVDSAVANECKIINSYHNFDLTPDFNELTRIATALDNNCDIIKIACKVNSRDDLLNLLAMYKEFEPGKLISLGLGELGKISRVAALFLGAPFTYASVKNCLETAEGQMDFESMIKVLDNFKK